jgi:general secretion pathway protein H
MAVIAGSPFGRARQPTPAVLVRQMATLTAHLEAKAVAKALQQSITVDIAARTVTIGDTRIEVPQEFTMSIKTGVELTEQGIKGSILLFPDGTSSGGEISLVGRTGRRATFRINWVTGAMSFVEDTL